MKIFISFLLMFLISCTPELEPDPEPKKPPSPVAADAGTSVPDPFDAGASVGTGNGSVLLPGNSSCANEDISVISCGDVTTLNYNDYAYELVEIGGLWGGCSRGCSGGG